MNNITVEQAKALLAAEPFAIVQVAFDEESYQDGDFEPVLLASNVPLEPKELEQLVSDDLTWTSSEFASCFVTFLFNLKWVTELYPREGAYLEATEVIVLTTEPIVFDTEEQVQP